MSEAAKERVGIVGVGRMGHSMLKHLVKKGYSVTACDVSADALAKAKEVGAATAPSRPRSRSSATSSSSASATPPKSKRSCMATAA